MDKQVAPLLMLARKMPVDEMNTMADQTDSLIEEAKTAIATVWSWLDSLSEGISDRFEQDLKAFVASEAKPLMLRMGRMDLRVARAKQLNKKFRAAAECRAAGKKLPPPFGPKPRPKIDPRPLIPAIFEVRPPSELLTPYVATAKSAGMRPAGPVAWVKLNSLGERAPEPRYQPDQIMPC